MIPWIQALSLFAPLALTDGSATSPEPGKITSPEPGVVSLAEVVPALDDLRLGGLLRAYYDHADNDLSLSGEDVAGFRVYDAQVWALAEAFGFELFVRMDAGEASAWPPFPGALNVDDGVTDFEVRDAYVSRTLSEQLQFYFGQFKCPLVASGNVGDGNLAMIERTRIGQLFSMPGAYQPGAALLFHEGPFHAKAVLQDGADEATDGNGIVLRGEYSVGQGAPYNEGALGATEEFNGTFGVGFFKDNSDGAAVGTSDFGRAFAIDGYVTFGQLSGHAEILDVDDDLAAHALGNTSGDDGTPYSATVGYLINEQWEAFLRYQDLDNDDDATQIGAGVNYYVHNHLAKWQAGIADYDDDIGDGVIFQIGLSIGLSQPNGG
jgi:hypothetical protein